MSYVSLSRLTWQDAIVISACKMNDVERVRGIEEVYFLRLSPRYLKRCISVGFLSFALDR